MKEKIFKKLKSALGGKTSLSDRTIEAKALQMSKKISTEEDLTDDIINDTVEDLKVMEGQFNHDVADAVNRRIDDLRRESDGGGQPKSKELQELLDFKARIEEEARQREQKSLREQRAKNIDSILLSEGCTDDFFREHVMLKYGVDGEDESKIASKLKAEYNKVVSERNKATGSPYGHNFQEGDIDEEEREKGIQADLDKEKERYNV